MKFSKKNILWCGLLLLSFSAGVLLSEFADSLTPYSIGSQIRGGQGMFTNPLLECDIATGLNVPKVRFERELRDYVEKVKERDGITDIAVYYRDLNNGPTFGVQESVEFFPASLLKVPVYLAFLKHAERDPDLLKKKLTFTSDAHSDSAVPTIMPDETLEIGVTYTVEELLERMIKYSDNDALNLLYPLLPEAEYVELFKRLGLTDFSPQNSSYTLSAREYSTFFRVLFNASFLSQESSETALKLLADTRFNEGLKAGVPDSVQVAHKFGERELSTEVIQLHDCGIVYAEKEPYLLCIMSRGTNQQAMKNALRDISAFTFTKVTAP